MVCRLSSGNQRGKFNNGAGLMMEKERLKEKEIFDKLRGARPKECASLIKKLFKLKIKKGRKN